MKRTIRNFFIFLALLLVPAQVVLACGCGIAIADPKIFNALKETQAYLLIDVEDANTYTEMPYFRFVSMERASDVKIVFPIHAVPDSVQGEKISGADFLKKYGLSKLDGLAESQNLKQSLAKVGNDIFQQANGVIGYAAMNFVVGSATDVTGDDQKGLVASFTFEGGTLNIYDVKSAQTLATLVDSLGIAVGDKVAALVQKYKDYYTAVLELGVPTVIPESEIIQLEKCSPKGMEQVRQNLRQQTIFRQDEINQLVLAATNAGKCSKEEKDLFSKYVGTALDVSGTQKGTLVKIRFENSEKLFYPTSVVSTYTYPVNDQRYFIKVPNNLHVRLDTSSIAKTVSDAGSRWYKVTSTEADINGSIVSAPMLVRWQDALRKITMTVSAGSGILATAILLLSFTLPLVLWWDREKIGWKRAAITLVLYFFGGYFFMVMYHFSVNNRRLAITYSILWGIFLALYIVHVKFLSEATSLLSI